MNENQNQVLYEPPVLGSIKDFVRSLVEPFPWIEDSERRRQSIVLSILLFALVLFTFFAGIIPLALYGDAPIALAGSIIAEIGLIIGIFLLKTGHFDLISKSVVWFMVGVIFLAGYQREDLLMYLIVPIIVISLFQSLKDQVLAYLAIVVLAFIIPHFVYQADLVELLSGYFAYALISSILVLIVSWNRRVIDFLMVSKLQDRIRDLENQLE